MSQMNLTTELSEKIRKAAQNYGIRKLAEIMNLQRGTLYNKLNTDDSCTHHKLTLQEFIDIIHITSDYDLLNNLCALFNYSAYKLPNKTEIADEALLDIINSIHISSGRTHKEMADALADGQITTNEYTKFSSQVMNLLSGIVSWQARVKVMVDG